MCTLLIKTKELMANRRELGETLESISKGTGLPYPFLSRFSGNHKSVPSVDRVQVLYEYLARRKLEV